MKAAEIFGRLFSGERRLRLIVALGLIGMALVLLSQLLPEGGEEIDGRTASFTSGEYRDGLERELAALLTGIEGVGRASVMVTLESGIEYRYAKEEKRNTDATREGGGADEPLRVHEKETLEESFLLVDQNGERQPLLQTQLQPVIKGVVIVCDGANNPAVQLTLTGVITTALDVPSTKVCIVKTSE